MKIFWLAAFLSSALHLSRAEDIIQVDTKIIDCPASLKLSKSDFQGRNLLEYPGLNMLTAPRMILLNGKSGTIAVQEPRSVRSAEDDKEMRVPTGVQLKILPRATEGQIAFTANITVRDFEGEDKSQLSQETEFSTREFYFSGACADGGSVLVNSKSIHNNRRVSLYLVFTRQREK
ncbi:MAG TPA: hypothetical protein VMZ27_00975 [Candidatus Saccharimonadales bacterium]|nr:hypothetical protein [Candidatus Saccharimonadales bacterium]